MAYADPLGTFVGAVDNDQGNPDTLFKTTFTGLILREYEGLRQVSKMIRHKWANRGVKGRDFRLIGTATARYHTRGQSIIHTGSVGGATAPPDGYLSEIAQAEKTIYLSDTLLAATSVADIDTVKQEFDQTQELAAELARALADKEEDYAMRAILQASLRTTDLYTGEPANGGTENITGWGAMSATAKQTALYDAFLTAKAQFASAKIPRSEWYAVIHTDYENFLTADKDNMNKDWGGVGSISRGEMPMLHGFKIMYSPYVPISNLAQEGGEKNSLGGDYTDYIGAFFSPDAAGRVAARDLTTDIWYDRDTKQWILEANQLVGHGSVRRVCARGLKKTDV